MRLSCTLLVLAALAPDPAAAVTRNVPADYATIQLALNASGAGDVVLVAPGTYHETLQVLAAQDGVSLMSSGGPDVTILDGGHQVFTVVGFESVGPATRLVGFTIMNGGSPPSTTGGGIQCFGAAPEIRGNIIRDNAGQAAGGLYLDGASAPWIVDNVILDNDAPNGSGGGIYCDHGSNARIEGNVIARNTCAAYGGGITVWAHSAPTLIGNTIVANQAALTGGGVYVVAQAHVTSSHDLIAFNSAGGGVRVDDALSSAALTCDDVYGNAGFDVSGNVTATNGESADPLFCNLATLDLTISFASPCTLAHSGGCGRIGARDPGCGVTPARRSSWGALKAAYR